MIKIESVEGICTIVREGEECTLFPGMQITPEEVETITAGGDLVYCIDETAVVVVPKGTKATVSAVEVKTEETKEEESSEGKEETTEEVVPQTVEDSPQVTAKK